jgi:methylated-DNA-[protein]-cysteine S-methyltransferase
MNLVYYHTEIGRIGIAEQNGKITNLFFETDPIPQGVQLLETGVLKMAASQLQAYLEGSLQAFSLPLDPLVTPFMKRVLTALCSIPYGTTASYKDVAIAAGSPKAARAVGMANNRNPIPIFIPCHRVIGANGKLTGYRGGLELKEKLLGIERLNV